MFLILSALIIGLNPFVWNKFYYISAVCGQQECDFTILGWTAQERSNRTLANTRIVNCKYHISQKRNKYTYKTCGTIFYLPSYLKWGLGFFRIKCMFPVISVIDDSILAITVSRVKLNLSKTKSTSFSTCALGTSGTWQATWQVALVKLTYHPRLRPLFKLLDKWRHIKSSCQVTPLESHAQTVQRIPPGVLGEGAGHGYGQKKVKIDHFWFFSNFWQRPKKSHVETQIQTELEKANADPDCACYMISREDLNGENYGRVFGGEVIDSDMDMSDDDMP